MATYKVLQDIEAEDKLVGPLTLRQFIYAAVMVVCLYICFIGVTKHAAVIILPIFLPPALVAGFFAFPWKGEQPTEIWALAKIRFMIKPRKRVWDQSGIKELVTITAPKRIEHDYTNGLSQTEVTSRLRALADTIDSRGWAVKNVDPNNLSPGIPAIQTTSDRLVGVSMATPQDNGADIHAEDDMLDEQNNPVAQQFDAMMTKAAQDHRQQVINAMNQAQQPPAPAQPSQDDIQSRTTLPPVVHPTSTTQPAPANNYWFMGQQPAAGNPVTQVVAPGMTEDAVPAAAAAAEPTADEKALAERLREQNDTQQVSYAHLHTIQPLSVQQAQAKARAAAAAEAAARAAEAQAEAQKAASAMTAQPDPAIIALASNNDLNVATLARQANRENQESADEVVISLH
jgi:hypothetical protein